MDQDEMVNGMDFSDSTTTEKHVSLDEEKLVNTILRYTNKLHETNAKLLAQRRSHFENITIFFSTVMKTLADFVTSVQENHHTAIRIHGDMVAKARRDYMDFYFGVFDRFESNALLEERARRISIFGRRERLEDVEQKHNISKEKADTFRNLFPEPDVPEFDVNIEPILELAKNIQTSISSYLCRLPTETTQLDKGQRVELEQGKEVLNSAWQETADFEAELRGEKSNEDRD